MPHHKPIRAGAGADFDGGSIITPGVGARVGATTLYEIECWRPSYSLEKPLWVEQFHNLVTNEGLNLLLDQLTSAAVSLFVLLTDGTPTFALGDTMESHAGWEEVTAYSQSTRPACTLAAASGQQRTNVANRASYSINGAATVGGAAISTSNVKGGTAGVLYGGGAFSNGDRGLQSGDTLNVTATLVAQNLA